ncbi:type IX secretion system membrane protein PorP/SprF [Jiulongibacter sediminis]|uniref:PorP/SprF family type IX secretion system membrane protein n=1 Tax=Jiulongibacter sediminis TaxID=1605367 RepID=UPI0026F37C53|nr:type IX secretion system membrane protein PorP/SprF [Jiulongibacter sediminis]
MRRLTHFLKQTVHLLLVMVSVSVYAQNDPQFTQYVFNNMYLNPGATGMGGRTAISAIYRTQWTGYTGTFDAGGAPVTQQVSASLPFNTLKGGLGLYASNDQLGGGSTNREISASYAFHKRIGTNTLGLGVGAGLYSRILDGGEFRPREDNDPSIPSSRVAQTQPDFSAGVFLYNPTYQIGLSMKHINQPLYGFSTETAQSPLPRTMYLNGSLLIGVTYTLDVSPMFVIKSDFKTIAPEMGALVTYNSSLWAGVNYRWQDAASFLIGGNFLNNKLRAGYAMDYVVFGSSAKAPTSHEILLTYYLNPPRSGKKSIIRTPRYRY